MRIIDKNKDFYDFYQNIYHDNTFTFDRRNSYNLTKKEFSEALWYGIYKEKERYVLLQVCTTFWLFKLTFSNKIVDFYHDYELELLANWEDKNAQRELIKLSQISFWFPFFWTKENRNRIAAQEYENLIRTKDYREIFTFNNFILYKDSTREKRTIPILKNIGVAAFIDPLSIYLALEEFFALQKQDSERTESLNLTDKEKITNHGFDLKTSFRGK